MSEILIIYSTTDDHTLRICSRIKDILKQYGHNITLLAIGNTNSTNLSLFNKVVLGASIRYGKHASSVTKFVRENASLLKCRPSAFFSVNLVARKAGKDTPQTNPYLKKFLKKIPWQPDWSAVFAGKIDYPKYGFWDRLMIRAIMWITHGPTDPSSVIEFTDWNRVREFARVIHEM